MTPTDPAGTVPSAAAIPPPAAPRSWFDSEDAPGRRDLDTCIHCGLCLTACPTYRVLKIEPDSPRGRIYLMRGLADGRIEPDSELTRHLDQCLDCRACETVCPAGVPYGRMLEQTRGQLARRNDRPTTGRRLGAWVLEHVVAHRGRMHAVADLLRLGQWGPVAALMRSSLARRVLPGFAIRGFAMTPAIEPHGHRDLARVAHELPPGARMERAGRDRVFHPAGAARAHVGFFTTCVMDTMFPAINRDAVRLLVLAGCRVTVPGAQDCCGALHAHAGLRRTARALARRNVAAFAPGGRDAFDFIVNDSAGCGAALREYDHLLADHDPAGSTHAPARGQAPAQPHPVVATPGNPAPTPLPSAAAAFASRVRDVSEVLAELGLPPAPRVLASDRDPSKPLRVGYHDPCHLAHAQNVRAAPRALLRALPGVELVDLPNSDWCCGSAGVYNLTHPEMADAQLTQKLDAIDAVAPDVVVASNPGCMLHMARGAQARGTRTPIVHLLEVLARAYPPARG